MFRKLTNDAHETVEIFVDGVSVKASATDTIAAVLLNTGFKSTRDSDRSGAPRGPYCMMGSCFECLVEVDGAENRQACMEVVRDQMNIRLIRTNEEEPR